MPKKLYDLAVKTGSYTNAAGETKGRYENVGVVLQLDDGGKIILLKRSFNPAGVPFNPDSDRIAVSMFEPKDAQRPTAAPVLAPPALDDDITF